MGNRAVRGLMGLVREGKPDDLCRYGITGGGFEVNRKAFHTCQVGNELGQLLICGYEMVCVIRNALMG